MSPMVLAAVAVVVLFVVPLGSIPSDRASLEQGLAERDAVHEYAVAIEQDTLRALGGLSGNTTMVRSTLALEAWGHAAAAPKLPVRHLQVYSDAAAAHANLVTAVDSGSPDNIAPAFNAALEAASGGLRISNERLDTDLTHLLSTMPIQAGLDTVAQDLRDQLELDRVAAREARALGQVGVEMGVARPGDTARLSIAILEAERTTQALAAQPGPVFALAVTTTNEALQQANDLVAAGQLGSDGLAALWPPLQSALDALEEVRDIQRGAILDALLAVERAALTTATASGTVALALALAAPAAVWALQRRVVRPIIALHAATEGRSTPPLPDLHRADELGELTQSFARMSARVAETTQQLRAALEESNKGREALQHSFEVLDEANRLRQHILNTASHELRTPLTPMRIHLKLLSEEKRGPLSDGQRRSLDSLQSNLTRLLDVVNSMTQMHALQEGEAPVHVTEMDLASVTTRACDTARPRIEDAGIHFSWEPPGPTPAQGDPERVQQVLGIVLDNARRYTGEGGHVIVRVVEGPAVEVIDDGIGMSQQDMARLFQPFERGLGQPDAPGASGLGLAIARVIMERMGGSITGHSEGKGKGSMFRITLAPASL